jgi:hypothetical protein
VQEFTYPVKGKGKTSDLAKWLVDHAPQCKGYIYGHLHRWRPEWIHVDWKTSRTFRTLCLPSNGLWGDIGYATFRTSADRAVCSLELRDFYFPREPETSARPAAWKMKVEETRGQRVTFLYDRGEGA